MPQTHAPTLRDGGRFNRWLMMNRRKKDMKWRQTVSFKYMMGERQAFMCRTSKEMFLKLDLHWLLFFKCFKKVNKQTSFPWLKTLNKQIDLKKDNTVSYWFTLFICGGPCHRFCCKQCSGNLTLFSYSKDKHFWVRIMTSLMLISKFWVWSFSSQTRFSPFHCTKSVEKTFSLRSQ